MKLFFVLPKSSLWFVFQSKLTHRLSLCTPVFEVIENCSICFRCCYCYSCCMTLAMLIGVLGHILLLGRGSVQSWGYVLIQCIPPWSYSGSLCLGKNSLKPFWAGRSAVKKSDYSLCDLLKFTNYIICEKNLLF